MGHISVNSIYDCGGCSIITSRGPNIYQGDTNVNPNHPTRPLLLQEFLERYNLLPTPLGHTTYHHFMGNGASHSQLDILIYSSGHSDKLVDIICKVDNPLVTSSHDVIVSSFELSPVFHQPQATPKAPRAPKPRFRVVWDNSDMQQYSSILEKSLPPLLSALDDSKCPNKVSSLLTLTNQALNNAANQYFRFIELSKPHKPRKAKTDPTMRFYSSQISKCCAQIKDKWLCN